MNKKEWVKYNQHILQVGNQKGQRDKDIDEIKKICKNNHIKLITQAPKNTKREKENKLSKKNVIKYEEDMIDCLSEYFQSAKVSLDFNVKLKKEDSVGTTAMVIYEPFLCLNLKLQVSKNGYKFTKFIKDLMKIDPSIDSEKVDLKEPNFLLEYELISPKVDKKLIHLTYKFLTIPNIYRQMNWQGSHIISKN